MNRFPHREIRKSYGVECNRCHQIKNLACYTKSQLKKKRRPLCKECVQYYALLKACGTHSVVSLPSNNVINGSPQNYHVNSFNEQSSSNFHFQTRCKVYKLHNPRPVYHTPQPNVTQPKYRSRQPNLISNSTSNYTNNELFVREQNVSSNVSPYQKIPNSSCSNSVCSQVPPSPLNSNQLPAFTCATVNRNNSSHLPNKNNNSTIYHGTKPKNQSDHSNDSNTEVQSKQCSKQDVKYEQQDVKKDVTQEFETEKEFKQTDTKKVSFEKHVTKVHQNADVEYPCEKTTTATRIVYPILQNNNTTPGFVVEIPINSACTQYTNKYGYKNKYHINIHICDQCVHFDGSGVCEIEELSPRMRQILLKVKKVLV